MPKLHSRQARYVGAIVAVVLLAVPPAGALAQQGRRLGFRDTTGLSLTFVQALAGAKATVCNVGRSSARRLRTGLEGFEFTYRSKALSDRRTFMNTRIGRRLAGGNCRGVRIRLRAGTRLDSGAYRGVLAVTSAGAGIARLPVTINGPPTPERVTLRLDLTPRTGETTSTLTIRVRLEGRLRDLVSRLRAARKSSAAYHRALSALLKETGIWERLDDPDFDFLDDLVAAPDVLIDQRKATIVAVARGTSIWSVDRRGESFRVRPPPVSRGVAVTLSAVAHGAKIVSSTPLPTREPSSSAVLWELQPSTPFHPTDRATRPAPDELVVTIDPPMSRQKGDVSTALIVGDFAVFALPFLAVLLLGAPRRRRRPTDVVGDVDTALLRRFAWTGVAMATACAVGFSIFDSIDWLARTFHESFQTVDAAVTGVRYAIALLALAFFASPPDRGDDSSGVRWARLLRALALLAASIATGVAVGEVEYDQPGNDSKPATLILIAGGAVGLVLLFSSVRAWGRWIQVFAPEVDKYFRRLRLAAVASVACAGIVAQFLLSTWSRSHGSTLQVISTLTVNRREFQFDLLNDLMFLPLQLANLSLYAAQIILSIALAVVLWRHAGSRDGLVMRYVHRRRCVLLFAILIISTSGRIDGYAAPLPFAVGLAVGLIGLAVLARQPRAILVSRIARLPAARGVRQTLLRRAATLILVKQRRAKAYDAYAADDDEAKYDRTREELRQRERGLVTIDALAGMRGPQLEPSDLLGLGLGLGPAADPRSRLRLVLRHGWLIVAVFAGYGVFALLKYNAGSAFTRNNAFGGAYFGLSVVRELVLWAVAVWLFSLLYAVLPWRVGPLRGLAIVGLFLVAWTASAPLLAGAGGPRGWLFTGAELILLYAMVGALIDFQTVLGTGLLSRQLLDLYQVTNVRSALAYLAPLLILVVTVLQQLLTGDAGSAVTELVRQAPSLLPTGR